MGAEQLILSAPSNVDDKESLRPYLFSEMVSNPRDRAKTNFMPVA